MIERPARCLHVLRNVETGEDTVAGCPRRDSVAPETCCYCDYGGGFLIDPDTLETYVRCLYQPKDADKSRELLREELDRAGALVKDALRSAVKSEDHPMVLSVKESAPLSVALTLMLEEGIFSLHVLNDAGRSIGTLRSSDILSWLASHRGR